MQTDPNVWDELTSLADAGRSLVEHDTARLAELRVRLDHAIERVQALERELQGIADDFEAL